MSDTVGNACRTELSNAGAPVNGGDDLRALVVARYSWILQYFPLHCFCLSYAAQSPL